MDLTDIQWRKNTVNPGKRTICIVILILSSYFLSSMILAAFFTIATDNELLSKYKEQTPDTDCKQVLAQFGDNIYEMVYSL